MIDVKYIQLIVDAARKCGGMIVSNDLASMQTHQIPLIDAFVGLMDFKRLPYLIMPAQNPTPALIFKDTFLLDPSDVETPQTLLIDTEAHLLMCDDMRTFTQINLLYHCTERSILREMQREHALQIVGITTPEN